RPALSTGISNLWKLIAAVSPHIVVCTGNWALHALTSHTTVRTATGFKLPSGITSWRGSQVYLDSVRAPEAIGAELDAKAPIPCLPIIHPAAILRDWGLRHVTVHDLRARLGRFLRGSLRWEPPPTNDIWRPTLGDVRQCFSNWHNALALGEHWLSVDIETYAKK